MRRRRRAWPRRGAPPTPSSPACPEPPSTGPSSLIYLPLEHAENLALQHCSVALFAALRDEAPAELRSPYDGFLHYARAHRDVIAAHGRFPHRNAVLGRASTAAELAYLAQPGAGF